MTEHDDSRDESWNSTRDLLTHPYRRHLLYLLYLEVPPLHLADVADRLTAWETGDAPEQHLERRLRIYMSLYHDHLPELTDAELVEYDQQQDTVDLGTIGNQLESVMRSEFTDEIDELLQDENDLPGDLR